MRIVALYAPAGYGKTVLSGQIAGRNRAVCDCKEAATPWLFARGVVHALASLGTEGAPALAQFEIALTHLEADASSAIGPLLDAWRGADGDYTFVFENAESLTASSPLIPMLERLLAFRGQRRIVICARSPLPLRLSRVASLETIVVFRARDLRFTAAETQEIVKREGRDRTAEIMQLTEGWPILVQALKNSVVDTATSFSLERLTNSSSELGGYLHEEVLREVDRDALDALIALAAIPNARPVDVERALQREGRSIIDWMTRERPFLTCSQSDTYEVHPLLAAVIREKHAAACADALRAAAEGARANDEQIRLAELLCALGDYPAAAAAIDRREVLYHSSPPAALARVISSLPKSELRNRPTLWAMALLLAVFIAEPAEWLKEARYMWRLVRNGPDESAIVNVAAAVVSVFTLHGAYDEASAALDAASLLASRHSAAAATLRFRRATIAAQCGLHAEALESWNAIEAIFSGIDASCALGMYDIVARVARARGDRRLERSALRDAMEAAERSQLAVLKAAVILDAAFGAWFAGEEAVYREWLANLRTYLQTPIARGVAHFVHCADGSHRQAPLGNESLKSRALAYLIACGGCSSAGEALWCAERALEAATLARQPFYEVLGALAVAAFDSGRAAEMQAKAKDTGARVQSQALHDAIDGALSANPDCGFLAPFLSRLRSIGHEAMPSFRVSTLLRTVERAGAYIDLTDREIEIIVLLATMRRAMNARDIGRYIHPDRDTPDATNLVKVYVNRVRGKLGKQAILSTRDGYTLANDGHDDLLEIENLARLCQARNDPPNRTRLTDALATLEWEWFGPIELRIAGAARTLKISLIQTALACGDGQEARKLASDFVACDSCDEEARELLIRAYLLLGDQTGAMREYRNYRDVLKRELDAQPGEHLLRLVRA